MKNRTDPKRNRDNTGRELFKKYSTCYPQRDCRRFWNYEVSLDDHQKGAENKKFTFF